MSYFERLTGEGTAPKTADFLQCQALTDFLRHGLPGLKAFTCIIETVKQ